jgi:hypothetical protein
MHSKNFCFFLSLILQQRKIVQRAESIVGKGFWLSASGGLQKMGNQTETKRP